MIKWNTLFEIEFDSPEQDDFSPLDTATTIKVVHLDDSRYAEIEPGGMVDIAVNEWGARIIKVEVIDS